MVWVRLKLTGVIPTLHLVVNTFLWLIKNGVSSTLACYPEHVAVIVMYTAWPAYLRANLSMTDLE